MSKAVPPHNLSPADGPRSLRFLSRIIGGLDLFVSPTAALLGAILMLSGCTLGSGRSGVVRQPEFQELTGRVSSLEDVVVGRRAGGIPPGTPVVGAPGAGGYANPAVRASGSERARYNRALSMVRSRRYAEAASAFRSFLDDYPSGRLSPNARYWLGEAHYARGDFAGALAEFQRGFSDYPDSAKAPDCLLKAAYSQSRLGDGPGAMETMRVLLEYYPNSDSANLVRSGRSKF
jgi:tol-pal system protein YbgF